MCSFFVIEIDILKKIQRASLFKNLLETKTARKNTNGVLGDGNRRKTDLEDEAVEVVADCGFELVPDRDRWRHSREGVAGSDRCCRKTTCAGERVTDSGWGRKGPMVGTNFISYC
ncbi:hypothetical protein L6452_35627 [Arctium lappa]|uniref:Uncharacterized protein n=1 Tax=Arctium lappa TaxID=4217 RepID=A0ACB8Y6Z4_ARCLA|nr:hypothetical protein L6452_35627 [Arctium lappa]